MIKDKQYYERISKYILEIKYGKFHSLINSDSPDLRNNDFGIEVTRAVKDSDAKLSSFFDRNAKKYYSDISQRELKKFGFTDSPKQINDHLYCQRNEIGVLYYLKDKKKNGLELIFCFDRLRELDSCVDEISKAIETKISKMNDHYALFKENDIICVIEDQLNLMLKDDEKNAIIYDLISEIINSLKQVYLNNQAKIKFNYIYLFFLDNIFEINTASWCFEQKEITQKDWDTIKLKIA